MRVTQNMISNNMMRHISGSYDNLNTYMNQLSSGKKIARPSDDPVTAMEGINYRSQTAAIEQYKRNTSEAHNWFDNSDAALDKATQTMQKIQELAVQASSDSNDKKERNSIRKETEQLKEHLADIANTKANDKYIFNGTDTNSKPIEKNDQEDWTFAEEKTERKTNPVMIEVADDIKIQANVNPEPIFNKKLFDDIDHFNDALEENDSSKIEKSISQMDEHIDSVIDSRADLGARMNRLELVENRLGEQEEFTEKALANNEDVDYEKVITKLKTQESMHRAALSAGSRIIQPSLIDFLN